jgi:hypothetical protein
LHHLTIEADDGMDVLFVCPSTAVGGGWWYGWWYGGRAS